MKVTVNIVNAFTDDGRGGNPAGVVLDAEQLGFEQKQGIAARVGLSETAFILPSRSADFKLEFFTPVRQIAHCGHATIASFSFLQQTGRLRHPRTSKETIDGTRAIHLEGESAFMEQLAPQYFALSEVSSEIDSENVLHSIGLTSHDLLDNLEPMIVATGNRFLVVPLRDKRALRKASPRHDLIEAISEKLDLVGYYPFSPDPDVPGRHASTRMFAPRYGIPEEAATGMAAGPLACFLVERLNAAEGNILIEQGRLMSPESPSLIQVRLDLVNGKVLGLKAGGSARLMERRTIHL